MTSGHRLPRASTCVAFPQRPFRPRVDLQGTYRFELGRLGTLTGRERIRLRRVVTHEQNTRDETLDGPPGNDVVFGGELGSRSYFDLAGTWDVNETYSLRLGINNLLDQDPPLVDTLWSGPGTPNAWGPYDALGRQVFFCLCCLGGPRNGAAFLEPATEGVKRRGGRARGHAELRIGNKRGSRAPGFADDSRAHQAALPFVDK
jgi:hypothetical protein